MTNFSEFYRFIDITDFTDQYTDFTYSSFIIVPRTSCDVIVKTIAEKSKRLVSEYSFLPRTRKKSDVFLLGDVEFDLNMGPCEKFQVFDVLLIG